MLTKTFLFIAYLFITEGTQLCDEGKPIQNCRTCHNTTLICNGAQIGSNMNISHDYETLNITHDDMTILPPLTKFIKLSKLVMNYNGIRLLSDGALENMTNLKHLSLAYNRIIDLDEKTFNGLRSLEILDLTLNRLYLIDYGIFTPENLPVLRHLLLGKNNIVRIEKNAFDGLSELTTLDLSSNRLENLEMFASTKLTSLMILNLGYNKIYRIPEDFFEAMPVLEELILEQNFLNAISQTDLNHLGGHLVQLNLQGNLISEVKSKCFKDMDRLAFIDLSHNRIKELKAKAFPERALDDIGNNFNLRIHDNPVNCSNCNNAWIRTLQYYDEKVMCDAPYNTTFGNIKDALFSDCQASSDSSMKTTSLFIFLAIVFFLLVPIVAYGMYRLRKQRRRNATLAFGQRPNDPGLPADKGVFTYRGLKDEFPFSIEEGDENRL